MSMRAPYILLSSSKAAAARAFHPSLPPSPVRGSSAAAKAAKAREGEASKAARRLREGQNSCDFGVSRALPLGHEKGYRRVASSSLLWRSEGGGERRALVWVPSTYQY